VGQAEPQEREALRSGVRALGLSQTPEQETQLLAYLALLRRWGQTYNLVAPGEMPRLLSRHLLDALAIARFCPPGPLLDVGTGAGFPGLPLGILAPERRTVLLDSAGKKVRFLRHVVRELGLTNVMPVHERLEQFDGEPAGDRSGDGATAGPFATVTSRAFSNLADFVTGAGHLVAEQGHLLAMKGQRPVRELKVLPPQAEVVSVEPLSVPGLEEQRHLVILRINRGE